MVRKEYWRARYEKDFKPAYDALMKFYPFTLEDLDGEQWADIAGYEGLYQVSNFGRVKSLKQGREKIMKPRPDTGGYLQVAVYNNGKKKTYFVHRLVAMAFIPNPDNKPQINHINGIKTDNHVENLEWVTAKENSRHAFNTGLHVALSGENIGTSKLTNEQAKYIRTNPDNFTLDELAVRFGVSKAAISFIQRGKTFKIVDGVIRCKQHAGRRTISTELQKQIKAEYQKDVEGRGALALTKKYHIALDTLYKIVRSD